MSTQYLTEQTAKATNTKAPSIFLWPSIFGSMILVGLVAALVDDGGMIETIALVLLSVPTVLMLYVYALKRHMPHKD